MRMLIAAAVLETKRTPMSLIKTALFATMLATTGFSIAHESGGHARHREAAEKAQQEWGIAGESRTATRTAG